MSHKARKPTHGSPADLRVRIERALTENRTQQALELSRTLNKQEPGPESKELLRKSCLARGRDLAAQGKTRDATEVLCNALNLDSDPTYLAQVAVELANIGQAGFALATAEKLTDPQAKAKILGMVVDEAVRRGKMGSHLLPEALRPQLELVLQAFALQAEGKDDAAREQLQSIGLTSPFLEWKLLLRGLLAYHANDDVRAIENWSRLTPERWPFKLAAPLRAQIDKPFAEAQTPAARQALQQQLERLQGGSVPGALKALQKSLATGGHSLAGAFREAEKIVSQLKQTQPDLARRLGWCLYWAIIDHGEPEDKKRYLRVFGPPPDDPQLQRLEAVALERRGAMREAHSAWQTFERSIVTNSHWPQDLKDRLRALVWWHMGQNAQQEEEEPDLGMDMPFFLGPPPTVKLTPPAEKCYEKSIELAPDQLDAHRALFDYLLGQEKTKKALEVGKNLLKRFPDHVDTIEKMGDLHMVEEAYGKALENYQQAARLNPLEYRLRAKVSTSQAFHAREMVDAGKLDEARKLYESSLALNERGEKYPTLCKWAASEFKLGDRQKGEELLAQAFASEPSRVAVIFSMLIETIRFHLTKLKPQFNTEFNQLLEGTPTGRDAASIARTSAALKQAGVKYHGQQTHEKKVLKFLEKAVNADFSAQELESICSALATLRKRPLELEYIRAGQRRFPENPKFLIAEVMHHLQHGRRTSTPYALDDRLKKARALADQLPREQRDDIMKEIDHAEEEVKRAFPFARMFGALSGFFGGPDFAGGFDDDEYDDEY